MPRILVFAGSTRHGSLNRKLAAAAVAALQAQGAKVSHIDLIDFPMPIYNGDLEAAEGLPPSARALRAVFKQHDALVIASPENNASVSALLRNALDWASRPDGAEDGLAPYRNKIALLLAASPGALGGMRGLRHLRDTLEGLGVLVLPQTLAVGHAETAFDADGRLDEARATTLLRLTGQLLRITGALATRDGA